MTEKLKPCPFCGSENIEIVQYNFDITDIRYRVVCGSCSNGTTWFLTKDGAVKHWNRRAWIPPDDSV